jgi:hypothetical protein
MIGREYEVLGLVVAVALRPPKGQMLLEWYVPTGEVGLAGRIDRDLSAAMAVVCVGVSGGEMCVELGRDGDARGMMSLCSGGPEKNGYWAVGWLLV